MSDGPHKSLPMRRHWQDLAERAANMTFTADQVGETVPYVLQKDFREAPVDTVREILGGARQGSLFPNDRIEQLEAARESCRGSAAGNTLIDCAIESVAAGLSGDVACKSALENALKEHTRNGFRSVEEHYQREARESVGQVRDRLDAARTRCDFGALASDLLSPDNAPRTARLPKHSDVDEGPPL
jgi:hypothetical protein